MPLDVEDIQTNNRAELRSAILAVDATHWPSEGIDNLVIAMNSAYVVKRHIGMDSKLETKRVENI